MFSAIYPFAFLFSLATLTGWFYFSDHPRHSRRLRNLFFAGIAMYFASWLFSEGEFSYKAIALTREMLVLSLFPFIVSLCRKNKLVYFAVLFAGLGALRYFYFEKLAATFPQSPASQELVELDRNGELLMELKEGRKLEAIEAVILQYDLHVTPAFSPADRDATDLDEYYLVDIPSAHEHNRTAIVEALSATEAVIWIEENERYTISPIEVRPQRPVPDINKRYGLNDPGLEHLWGFEEMAVEDLYQVLEQAKPVKTAIIAILDTGVDSGHEDLKDNYVSTNVKYDRDRAGHGTHCAGIAGAVSNNNIGVASFSRNNEFVRVTSIKVLSDGGFGTQKMIINGMLEAADRGVDVISLSLGGFSTDSKQRAYRKAVEYASKKGAVVVVAAGNSNTSAKNFAPANTPGVIAVSAVDTLLNRASFSNKVDEIDMGVAAPGVGIYSTFPGDQYQTFNGTSMATPYVAGLLGLMKSLKPELTTEAAFRILDRTGKETGAGAESGKLIQPGPAIRACIE